jgi:histo-blood group ABO system transferase
MTKKTAILTIATGNYIQFLWQYYYSVKQNFEFDVDIICFTDYEGSVLLPPGVIRVYQKHYQWPGSTLYRWHIFVKNKTLLSKYDFLIFTDIDMKIVGKIDESVFSDLTAVLHPGFYNKDRSQFSYETRPESACYIPLDKGTHYYCGGVQMGFKYLETAEKLVKILDSDLDKGLIPVWHDESVWNFYLCNNPPALSLAPLYCFPGNERQSNEWALSHLTPKIVALDKDHAKARGESCLL